MNTYQKLAQNLQEHKKRKKEESNKNSRQKTDQKDTAVKNYDPMYWHGVQKT